MQLIHQKVAQPKPDALSASSLPLSIQHRYQTGSRKASVQSNGADICLCFPPDRNWHKINDSKVDYSADWGRGRLGTYQGLSPAGLYWSLAHLVQCRPNGPSWTWTQIWVQACMPDYSVNWTARSRAIQGWQRFQWCSSLTWRWPRRSHGPFGLKSAIEHWPSSMDPRQSTEKPLHEAMADRTSPVILSERFI